MTFIALARAEPGTSRPVKCMGCGATAETAAPLADLSCDCRPVRPLAYCRSFIGQELRREQCRTCPKGRLVKVFVCERHGECTLAKAIPGVQCCTTCGDFTQD